MSHLVLDKMTGELMGFTDLGDPELNFDYIRESWYHCFTCSCIFCTRNVHWTQIWHTFPLLESLLHNWCHCYGRQSVSWKPPVTCGLLQQHQMVPLQTGGFLVCTINLMVVLMVTCATAQWTFMLLFVLFTFFRCTPSGENYLELPKELRPWHLHKIHVG